MARGESDDLPTVDDWADVPEFANEREEAEFWGTLGLGGAALESLGTLDDDALPPPRPRSRRHILTNTSEFLRTIPSQPRTSVRMSRPQIVIDERTWLRAS